MIRAAVDFTAREKAIPVTTGRAGRGRKPTKGKIVRPLARRYRGRIIDATAPHRQESFVRQGRILTCLWFDDLVLAGCEIVFHCVVILDPSYKTPWILLTDLRTSGETIFRLYQSRWKIKQLPQTGKQLLGGCRSFVHGDESRFRLPELRLRVQARLRLRLRWACIYRRRAKPWQQVFGTGIPSRRQAVFGVCWQERRLLALNDSLRD